MTGLTYLESSAFVKLVAEEAESSALIKYLRTRPRQISSILLQTEVMRAAFRHSQERAADARVRLEEIELIEPTRAIFESAATLQPHNMRTLDAIHVATALHLGNQLDELVTYDRRMAEAAQAWGITTVSPA